VLACVHLRLDDPDCTIDVVLLIPFPVVPAPIPFKFSGAFADEGRDLAIILIEPAGSDVRILLRKQRKEVAPTATFTVATSSI